MNDDGEVELRAALRCHDRGFYSPEDWRPPVATEPNPGVFVALVFFGVIALIVFGEVTGCEMLALDQT